jgi:potassium efflux system protein
MFFTLIAASSWPLLFLIAGWHIRAEPFGEPFSALVGRSLMYAATYWFILSLWWWVLHPEGLGRRHFRWALPVTSDLAKQIRWFVWIFLPTVFILAATNLSDNAEYIKALGRPALVLLMLAVAAFVWRGFGPASPFTEQFRHQHHSGWMGRMQFLWLPIYIAISTALAVASLLGYDYTAVQLLGLFLTTIVYLVALWILKEVLMRWFYVAERRLRLQEAIRRRDEMRAQQKEEDKADSESVDVEIPGVDYKSLGEQGRAIVQVAILISGLLAMWLLWGDLLPAFSFITDVPLPFDRVMIIDGLQQNVPVTVGTFAVGLLVLLGTLFATRNLSGLLELTLLSRLGLDSGRRYAAITLSRYLIITVGIIVALSIIGLQWSKLSWLIAAMGVGLGFGLQEIVANFVSGIILLIERPIRIGDMVSVGDSTGTVARIQIRATTIITLERKELLVPNKEFVTGRVLNWTLSNEQMRLLVKVGIAYGSDVGKAMELIMQAAGENERVLDDPYPVVTFEEFGDNSLELSLRAFIASVETRLTTSTELNQAIYEKFNEAGITIAFPQRDVHLDTSAPLEVNITHEQ